MSLCLQDMVDELVMKKKGARIKRVIGEMLMGISCLVFLKCLPC